MNNDLLTIKLKLDNLEQEATNYVTVAKTAPPDRDVDPNEEVRNVNKERSPRDPNKFLILTANQKYKNVLKSRGRSQNSFR